VVRDNGAGIDPGVLDKIFLPFFKHQSSGYGIGLSAVDKITRIYGGSITAYNDMGACFRVTLKDLQM
jgi:signal transduction histidine kinase